MEAIHIPRELDRGAVDDLLAQLITGGDVRAVHSAADMLAAMGAGDYAYTRGQLKNRYGAALNLPALDKDVKRAQLARRHAERTGARRVAIHDVATDDPRPRVCLTEREPVSVAREILAHLEAQGKRIYQRDTQLVRVRRAADGRPLIETLDEDRLAGLIQHTCICYRTRVNDIGDIEATACPPPRETVRLILAEPAWKFQRLAGIAEGPVVRADGSIAATAGYDAATGLYVAPGPDVRLPTLPEHPTQADARAAAAHLAHTLSDMPFADAAGLANTLALALTVPLRSSIKGNVPLALVDATRQGSAKTLLATWALVAGTGLPRGQAASQVPWPESREEQQKRLETALMDGATRVFVDNVRGVVNSTALEQMLTSPTHACRRLGKSEQPVVSSRATWVFTGNGLRPGGDLFRRIYFVHLDTGLARPDERDTRTFAIGDMEMYLEHAEHRAQLVGAVLTMYAAWHAAGRPPASTYTAFGSFQEWANLMGAVLEYAGVTGFLATHRQDKAGADEDSEEWEAFLLAWRHSLGNGAQFAIEVADGITGEPKGEMGRALPGPLLRTLGKPGAELAVVLGSCLRNRHGRRYGDSGVRVDRAGYDSHSKVAMWRVVLPEDDAPAPSPETPPETPEDAPTPAVATWAHDQHWYDATRADSPLSQAMEWACGDISSAAGWLASSKLCTRFNSNSIIIRLKAEGPQDSVAFAWTLRGLYQRREWVKIRAIAQTLGADVGRVVPGGEA